MPVNTRDLWLLLKAQDQTNRALNTFSRNVKNAGDSVAMAQLQAQRAAALGAIAQAKLANEVQRAAISSDTSRKATIQHSIAMRQNAVDTARAEIAQLSAQKTVLSSAAASMKAAGASATHVDAVKKMASTLGDEITKRRLLIGTIQADIAAEQGSVNTIQGSINARKASISANDQYIVSQKKRLALIDDDIKKVTAQNEAIQEHEKHLARMSNNLQQVSQTATAMGFAMSAAGVATVLGIKAAIDTAVAYEKQVRATATQVDGFRGNLEQLADIGRRLAKEIAVPFEQIQPALFDIFSSMEVNVTDAEKLLREFSKAAVAGSTDIQDVSRATIGLMNAFQRPVSDVNKLLDLQFQLVKEGVGTYEEWNQRIGLVTPSAVRAGQSIEMMMAALAASTRMGMSAARSGTAVARAFDALSNPKTVDNLKKLGVNVQDAQGKFRPFNEVLRDFRNVLDKMPEKDRLATILDVFKGAGGTIEARRFLQNILLGKGNLELFDNVLKSTSNSAGSMEQAYQLMADSAAAKTQLLANQWTLLKESVGKALTPAFATLVGWVAKLIEQFNNLDPHTKQIIAYFIALAAIFATVMGPLLLLIGAIAAVAAAFTVAGTAIAVVVGVLAAFVAVAATVTAVFVLLWKKSESFRTIISQMAENFKAMVGVMEDFAKRVGDSFKEHLAGPLSELWNVINTQVLPALSELYKMYSAALLPKLKEAAKVVGDLADGAFKQIGAAITNVVIPAIKQMVDWWNRNKEEIKPFLDVLAVVIKWLLIIAAVIMGVVVAALIGGLLAAVGAVVAVFVSFGLAAYYLWQGLKWLWDQLVTFAKWIAGVFVDAWNSAGDGIATAWAWLGDFFAGLWDSIKSIFSGVWSWITDTWNSFSGWFGGVWQDFWSSTIGNHIKVVWDFIVAVFNLGAAAIQFVIAWAMEGIKNAWTATWDFISSYFSSIWNNIVSQATAIWSGLVALWNTIWPPIRDFVVSVWNVIAAWLSDKWNSIVSAAKSIWQGIVNFLSTVWSIVKNGATDAWNTVYNVVADKLRGVMDKVRGWKDDVVGFFKSAGSWLYNAGKEIVEGLIRGIDAVISRLTDKINELTQKIKDHLPGSPVKTGPLRVLNHGYAGGQIVNMIADGMTARMNMLRSTANMMGSDISSGFGASFAQTSGSSGGDRVVNQTINVYTQEIDPRKSSAELGFELVKVL